MGNFFWSSLPAWNYFTLMRKGGVQKTSHFLITVTYFDLIRFLSGTLVHHVPKCLTWCMWVFALLDKQLVRGAWWFSYPTSGTCGLDGVTVKLNFMYHHLTAAKYFIMLCMWEMVILIKIVMYSLTSFLSLLFSFVCSGIGVFFCKLLVRELWVRRTLNSLVIIWDEDASKQSSLNRFRFFRNKITSEFWALSVAMLKCQQ